MRLQLDLVKSSTESTILDVEYSGALSQFPDLIEYKDKVYTWAFYDKPDVPSTGIEWVLTFTYTGLYSRTPVRLEDVPGLSFTAGDKDEKGCCGAGHTSFPWDHMFYCSKRNAKFFESDDDE